MAKAAPIYRAWNAGEFSPFMEGRTDNERFPISARQLENNISVLEGPSIRRSGTKFYTPIFDETQPSRLVDYAFNESQAFVLEMAVGRTRFINDAGLVILPATATVTAADPVANTVTLTADIQPAVGDQIILNGFLPAAAVNGTPLSVTAVAGNVYTVVGAVMNGFQTGATAVQIYAVATPFTAAELPNLRWLPSVDVVYAMTGVRKPQKFSRYGASNWTVTPQALHGGPYMDLNLTAGATLASSAGVITANAGAAAIINNGQGFLPTDVGRLVQIGPDTAKSEFTITGFTSSTQVAVTPSATVAATTNWRIGYFSDTTGWPTCATFFNDRLWYAGVASFPDLLVGSVSGDYDNFSTTNSDATVTDDRAFVLRLNARKLGTVAWLESDLRGLILGTASGIWTLQQNDTSLVFSPTNVLAANPVRRGAAIAEAAKVESEIVFIQRAQRYTRAVTYTQSLEGYGTRSLSLYAGHIGPQRRFAQLVYAEEPHQLVWHRCQDGTLASLLYDKEQQVIGWHRHTFKNGFVEDMAVIPSTDNPQDALWLQVRRTVNGVTRRYIERLQPFWEIDYELTDAWYVDCGVSYSGSPIADIYGLQHLEGQQVFGLADGAPVSPLIVANGHVKLPVAASSIVLGVGLSGRVETQRPDAGAADGTAQGKIKRSNRAVVRLFNSGGGRYGRPASPASDELLDDFDFRQTGDALSAAVPLYSGDIDVPMQEGYERSGTMLFVQPEDFPLPFNLIAVMPDIETQDR